ncbi:3-oxoacyl-synthase [Xylona heveae TC161]|uniref:Fatty acid synthase subunit alpha n=1 Tax=Xylona heveae (strain CBS 132557 / TC161) TaxID=1328760 RepID=A0A165FGW2_XYLHT|nr:3-oxoacyl-synthase [Xylona heveae TC161]KZF20965.1 3-oxoacyl-synthase [Xylona heveae TC161]
MEEKREERPSSLQICHEQSLSRNLLIELLAHQFAFPVKWIDTQNAIFQSKPPVKRVIEIGPSTTLTNIAKRTLKRNALFGDNSRTLISTSSDMGEILYHYKHEESFPVDTGEDAFVDKDESSNRLEVAQKPLADQRAPAELLTQVLDVPLSAEDVVLVVVASKLRGPVWNIDGLKSIRTLSGGKSTLQNEIVGDLSTELGKLPEGVEDYALNGLATTMNESYSHQPKDYIQGLISSFVATKMPAGLSQSMIRDYLSTKWGLGQGRQNAVLCWAAAAPPPVRFQSRRSAYEYFEKVVHHYAQRAGISLHPKAVGIGSAKDKSPVIDKVAFDTAMKEHREYLREHMDLLARHLGTEPSQFGAVSNQNQPYDQNLVELVSTEFDTEFLDGLKPRFDKRKERRFNSWWNWAREDIINLFHAQALHDSCGPEITRSIQRIQRRWDQNFVPLVQYLGSMSTSLERSADLKALSHDILKTGDEGSDIWPRYVFDEPSFAPKTAVDENGNIEYVQVPRFNVQEGTSYINWLKRGFSIPESNLQIPFVHLCRKSQGNWIYDDSMTKKLLTAIMAGTTEGYNFIGKTALVTGAGKSSIGAEIVRGLLEGGARVIVTTSGDVSVSAKFFESIYKGSGARHSELIILPFNQGSKKDCEELVRYLLPPESPIALDFIVPFAAISETGRQLDELDGRSELAHRIMLVNLLRLLGYLKQHKETLGLNTHPTMVILPLSPNHGSFGGDGLYSESKIGLETLFNRWHSESWSDYLTICGAVIGWTRGTALMADNNILAEAVEAQGTMTFSTSEMALNILSLMTPSIVILAEDKPIYADLTGGLYVVENLRAVLKTARESVSTKSNIAKAISRERSIYRETLDGKLDDTILPSSKRRALLNLKFPELPTFASLRAESKAVSSMVDLKHTIVIAGYSELGPWGNSRTRWEMEYQGELTLEGYVEMAWLMGLIKRKQGPEQYATSWVDTESEQSIDESDIPERYHQRIMNHSGIRVIEPEGLGGYDPKAKEILQEIVVQKDLPVFDASKSDAEAYKRRHGNHVTIFPKDDDSNEFSVQIKQGAQLLVPKAIPFDRRVAGQLPKGWNAQRYGIPEDIISQVDPITLYILCCVAEAFLSAGIKDPFELYQHVHLTEIANCLGTGVGGLTSMRGVYRDRYMGKSIPNDILQESFQNSHGAWANMLLLGATGPIRSPVGTCATGVESLDSGCEAIRSGNAKIAIVGGSDDFQEELSYEFANMKATTSSEEQLKAGRNPKDMSRPMTSSRAGFIESAGCGVQVLATAELALRLGLPIYGIVAYSQMAGDTVGRSVPAPGKGVLTAAREASGRIPVHLDSHRSVFDKDETRIREWRAAKFVAKANEQPTSLEDSVNALANIELRDHRSPCPCHLRGLDHRISPIRSALAIWGLTIDDINMASLHATSTKANDKNEPEVWNQMMDHLGRSVGNPLLCITQKYLTGHPKGAAGSWMLNGGLQVLQTGIIPGNRNADNIDSALQHFEHLVFPSRTIQTSNGVKSFMMTSFGFGQKGGLALLVAPRYLFAAINEDEYLCYKTRAKKRFQQADSAFVNRLLNENIVQVKEKPAWYKTGPELVFLDPEARVSRGEDGKFFFDPENLHPLTPVSMDCSVGLKRHLDHITTGIDLENISSVPSTNKVFVRNNFTLLERDYCAKAPNPAASLAGKWSAKEAVFKSLQIPSLGPGQFLQDIEIQNDNSGRPIVKLHKGVLEIAREEGIQYINVSITHSEDVVVAVAIAGRSKTM